MIVAFLYVATFAVTALADDDNWSQPASSTSSRYGPFDLFDHRSMYGIGVFPEPFLIDDSDQEEGEFRTDWLHTDGGGVGTTIVHPEIEGGFGLLTLELEAPYERDAGGGQVVQGMDNVDVGARHPIWQWVSADGKVDSTIGAGFEGGIPTGSPVGRNAEIVPKLFDDLRLGNHFTLQAIFGYSRLFGGGDEGGQRTFESGLLFGYTLHRDELPLPGVLQTIPVIELSGADELNRTGPGHASVAADAALRFNLKSIGRVEPRLGIGYLFPANEASRQAIHSGFIASFVFEL